MMKQRVIYPGPLNPPEIILLTGALYGAQLSFAAVALAEGVRSRGRSVSIAAPGSIRSYSSADQFGNPADWDMGYDVVIVEFGEYLGEQRFRHGLLSSLGFTRTVFFSPAAEYAVANSVAMPWEVEQRSEVFRYLTEWLPHPVHLARPSLIRPAGTEQMLLATTSEVLRAMERGEPVDPDLKAQRDNWHGQDGMDRVPKLERALW